MCLIYFFVITVRMGDNMGKYVNLFCSVYFRATLLNEPNSMLARMFSPAGQVSFHFLVGFYQLPGAHETLNLLGVGNSHVMCFFYS